MDRLRLLLRRLALAGSAITFGAIALASFVIAEKVAAEYAYTVGTADAWNEFRAVFTGFWLGLFAMMVTAYAVVVHGVPGAPFVAAMIGEMIPAVMIFQGGAVVGASVR
jgi:hypothetical protein